MPHTQGSHSLNDANRLGLDYRLESSELPYEEPIWDVHTHVQSVKSAEMMLAAMDAYGVEKIWSMSNLEIVPDLKRIFGDRIEFIAVPNFSEKDEEGTFTTDWYRRIEKFAECGTKICKFWAAPRGIDFDPSFAIDHPSRRTAMDIARDCGMMFMTHVGDPDTWFATHYRDKQKYGTKADHLAALETMLDVYDDVTWIAAHMAAQPEHLDVLQGVLDRHPNLYLDTSATKWMVRELSRHPKEFSDFCERNQGRVMFGSDIVTSDENIDFDLYASRYWSLRTMYETDYDGLSPIVDPDLVMLSPEKGDKQTADLRGASMPNELLDVVYHNAAKELLMPLYEAAV
ncbi:Amidohydrolase [Poriferisphaera corsica]|uniref:Amidohydrolase n=1 Tax=Poriferisphaera corsica TaxID=2528020 RepID=A0A517YWZ7_9BACT|nr:amidohydrolase family protein [Poriferisphaera corsica]QDU34740.1 Amidohydrolase [Poriferisphaera corsica]